MLKWKVANVDPKFLQIRVPRLDDRYSFIDLIAPEQDSFKIKEGC